MYQELSHLSGTIVRIRLGILARVRNYGMCWELWHKLGTIAHVRNYRTSQELLHMSGIIAQ